MELLRTLNVEDGMYPICTGCITQGKVHLEQGPLLTQDYIQYTMLLGQV